MDSGVGDILVIISYYLLYQLYLIHYHGRICGSLCFHLRHSWPNLGYL